jgi:methionyl-tRNA synthetase
MKYQDGVLGDIPDGTHDQGPYHEALASCRFDKALEEVWEQVRGLNQYIDTAKPWHIAKEGDQVHLREVLAYCVSCINEIAELLIPFMPATAERTLAIFKDGIVRMEEGTLFPRIDEVKN